MDVCYVDNTKARRVVQGSENLRGRGLESRAVPGHAVSAAAPPSAVSPQTRQKTAREQMGAAVVP